MIITAIINMSYSVLSWFIGVIPASAGIPAEAHSAAVSLGGYLGIFSPILPIATLLTTITLVYSVEIGIFTFKTFKWIFSHIPLVGGKG